MSRNASLSGTFVLWASVLTAASAAKAAEAVDATSLSIRRSGYQGAVSFITPKRPGDTIAVTVPKGRARLTTLAFLDQYGGLFGIADPVAELTVQRVETDALGQIHTTYQQLHKGVPVYSGTMKVHQNAKGDVLGANGRYYPVSAKLGVVPTLNADAAALAAKKELWHAPKAALEQSMLTVVDPGWYGDAPAGAKLAWFIVLNDGEAVREGMFIDAHTGEVIDRWSLIEQLLDREVYNLTGATLLPGAAARIEGEPAAGDVDVNKAYDYAADYYRFLQRAFGRDSIDNNGLTLVQSVNGGFSNCPNAFWNGVQTAYCSGMAEDDVVAHELTHGLTQYTAGLIYQNQSGQLNESYSDVFGEIVDLFNGNVSAIGAPSGTAWPLAVPVGPGLDTPNNARSVCSPRPVHPDGVRWLIGEGLIPFGGAIRDMWDPTCRGHPDRANSPMQVCPSNDNGGVHGGSGIPNHAFALVTDGGTFNGHTVGAIGIIKSGAVWYRALTTYLTPASDFKDAYEAMNQAALDLVGTTPNDPRTGASSGLVFTASDAFQVNEALLAVEMNTDGNCGQTNNVLDDAHVPLECPNATVLYSETFEGVSLPWTVANSAPPTPYNWVLTSTPLPFGRAGKAAFCEDRVVGNCNSQDESATHWMTSPPIVVPAGAARPYLAFTHLIGSEGAFDGGLVQIAINGGSFTTIPRSAADFNAYNGVFRPASSGNTNPLAGQPAWFGAGGKWGRTIINLASLGVTGTTIQLRFNFGKDGCTGGQGWYVDDLAVYDCPDCDTNGRADIRQFRYRTSTEFVGPIAFNSNRQVTLTNIPPATGNVVIELLASADLNLSTETIEVVINGTSFGQMFALGGLDCATTPSREKITFAAVFWNNAVALGAGGNTAVIDLIGSADMQLNVCGSSFVGVHVRYDVPGAADTNANSIIDSCETQCVQITQPPQPATILDGADALFSVTATGTGPLSYQWRRIGIGDLADGPSLGGGTISGTATASLSITGVGIADAASYEVVVSNTCGPVTSTSAELTVNPVCVTFDQQPQPVTIAAGDDAVFTVTAAGTAPLTYQWRRNDADLSDGPSVGGGTIGGSTTATLTITSAGYADGGAGPYSVVVENACGPVESDAAELSIGNPCPADFNASGAISVQDIFDFLAAYFAECLAPGSPPCYGTADFNDSGAISVQDIFDFLAAYFAGCP